MNTDLPTPNIPLLRKAVEWAEAEAAKPKAERLWEQWDYITPKPCGTAYCIAGWVVATTAPNVVLRDGSFERDGDYLSPFDEAKQLLGLTYHEAEDLFVEDNTIEDVREVAEQIAARAGERL